MPTSLSIVIPVYHDAEALAGTLAAARVPGDELIVASVVGDASLDAMRRQRRDIVWVDGMPGRARQMNAGAAAARGEWLLFLHADTRLPDDWRREIDRAAEPGAATALGCFRFALDSGSWRARVIELGVRLRVWLFHLPYGDQALFLRRDLFERLHGYADLPIMEDVDLVLRTRRHGRLFRSALPAVTSARRWVRDGWASRTARHLALITLYFCGVTPERLLKLDAARRHEHPDPPAPRMYL